MKRMYSELELKFLAMYKQGKSMQAIAEKFGLSSATVYNYLKRHIPIEERKNRQHKNSIDAKLANKFKNAYLIGFSSVEIAKTFNTKPDIVLYNLKKLKVDTSKNGKYGTKIDEKKLEKIKDYYEKTGSILKTGKEFGLHPSSVHYRLVKLGIIKLKTINQEIAKKKYKILTETLLELFGKMGFKIRLVQEKYNGHGPDMIIEKHEAIIIEHKATVKKSGYLVHAIEEAETQMNKYDIKKAIVITTAKKPVKFRKRKNIEIIFFEDLEKLLKENNLEKMIPKIEFISKTPSV